MSDRSSYSSSALAEPADRCVETATPADVREAAGKSPAAKQAAERVLGAWRRIQKEAAWAGERVRWKVTAVTPYVLAKMRALVARVATLAAQGIGWTLDQLLRLDGLTRRYLQDLAFYAVLTLFAIGCARDPSLLVRLGKAALSAILESVHEFLKRILRGLALLAARALWVVACWAWDLARAVVAVILEGLKWPAARVAEALTPSVEPVAIA